MSSLSIWSETSLAPSPCPSWGQPRLLLRALELLVPLCALLIQLLHWAEAMHGDLAENLDDDGGEQCSVT